MSEYAPPEVVAKILGRIEVTPDGCWRWPGATSSGYGRTTWRKESGGYVWRATHRVIYEAAVGPIPEGFDVDHQCHDPKTCQPSVAAECPHRRCCNPDHLRAMNRRENLLRGGTVAAARAAITECPAGHPYSQENTLVDKLGRRGCKDCTYERNRAYYWKNRERRKAYNQAWRAARAARLSGLS